MDRQGVEQLVAENHSVKLRRLDGVSPHQFLKIRKPADAGRKVFQRFLLPFLPARGGFDDPVFDLFEQFRAFQLQPGQDVPGQPAVMGAGLNQVEG